MQQINKKWLFWADCHDCSGSFRSTLERVLGLPQLGSHVAPLRWVSGPTFRVSGFTSEEAPETWFSDPTKGPGSRVSLFGYTIVLQYSFWLGMILKLGIFSVNQYVIEVKTNKNIYVMFFQGISEEASH